MRGQSGCNDRVLGYWYESRVFARIRLNNHAELSDNDEPVPFIELGVDMSRRRNILTRPWRRLRRWSQHTPNDQLALSMLGAGCLFVIVAGLALAFGQGWL
jgi:hypothetical protein